MVFSSKTESPYTAGIVKTTRIANGEKSKLGEKLGESLSFTLSLQAP